MYLTENRMPDLLIRCPEFSLKETMNCSNNYNKIKESELDAVN